MILKEQFLYVLMFLGFFSGTSPVDSNYVAELETKLMVQEYIIDEAYQDLSEAKCLEDAYKLEVKDLETILGNPNMIINKIACNDYYYKSQKSEYFLGTKFKMYPWINPKVKKSLLLAMMNYTGPEAFVTSAHRKVLKNKRSKHPKGLALDIKPNIQFLKWLETEEGSNWKKLYKVTVLVEDNKNSKWLKNIKKMKFKNSRSMVNKSATAAHIHIHIRKV